MMQSLDEFKEVLTKSRNEIEKVIIGQREVIEKTLITILTNNHALVEGVPGIAKTLLVRTLGQVLGCPSQRIQFTPDLMPADIIGTNVFNIQKNEFQLVKGPVFTTFLLADEINRAPAKTQSALLQAMQERQVTIDRESFALSPNFTVFATQNPIEYEGTYPLPEAQKDRFMLKITMDYPQQEDEMQLAQRMLGDSSPEAVLASGSVQQVLHEGELVELRLALQQVTVREELVRYIVEIVRSTRKNQAVLVGAGPRATQALLLSSRANAVLAGRDFVNPDDIKSISQSVLEHRLILRPEYELEGMTIKEVIQNVLQQVAVPR
jgi:MoxR-like ATPase